MSRVFIEGPDNSGKTTLVKQIAARYGLPTVVSAFASRKHYDDRMYELACRLALMVQKGASFVGDRSPIISESVYGPLLRGRDDVLYRAKREDRDPSSPWTDNYKWLKAHLFLEAPAVIYCRPPDHKILTFDDREQMEGVIENARELLNRYDNYFDRHAGQANILYYDWTETDGLMILFEKLDPFFEGLIMEESDNG